MNTRFEIVVRGHLPPGWSVVLEGMDVLCLPEGNTLLSGFLPDQAALYGLLLRLRDFGLTLVSINPSELKENEKDEMRG